MNYRKFFNFLFVLTYVVYFFYCLYIIYTQKNYNYIVNIILAALICYVFTRKENRK